MSYVKESAMRDTIANVFDIIDEESDIRLRMKALTDVSKRISERMKNSLELFCYQAKSKGMPTDLIATELGISQRAVLRMIRGYSHRNSVRNPLGFLSMDGSFDIRDHLDTSGK
jgi:uncharacterized membrane protein YheB (UPF0754 family)